MLFQWTRCGKMGLGLPEAAARSQTMKPAQRSKPQITTHPNQVRRGSQNNSLFPKVIFTWTVGHLPQTES